jgi:putative transposase
MSPEPAGTRTGLPHHVTQRGVRSADIFTDDLDRELYLMLMRQRAEPKGVRFLMK